MKNYIKALITISAILTVAAVMTVGCLAFDNTSNTQSMNELQQKADAYYEKVSGATTNAETKTYNAVKVYIDRIDTLRQITERDTSEEMALEGKKGAAAGILSWIYYSHLEEIEKLTASDRSAISGEYEKQMDVIDRAERDFFEGNGVTASYSRLLVEIYSRRIEHLRISDNGNGLVNEIIDLCQRQVQSRCAYSESFGEDAENCKIYYAEVSARIHLQTMRDKTIEELQAAAESIYPDTEFDMNPQGGYSAFFTAINDATLEEEYLDRRIGDGDVAVAFNNALYRELSRMLVLPDSCGEYKKGYHSLLDNTVQDRVNSANAEAPAEQVKINDLFSAYSLGLLQAEAKDEISEYADKIGRDANLDIVILEYTGAADRKGILDNTADAGEVDAEILSAKMRCVWYDAYRLALVNIKEYLGDGSDKAREAKVLYYAVDGKIKAGERCQGESIEENLSADLTEMRAVVDRAEAEKFTVDHRSILEKTDIRTTDKAAIISAILDANALGAGAQSFISDTLISLGEKYKAVTVEEINDLVTADGAQDLRKNATYRLTTLVNSLSVKDRSEKFAIKSMMETADGYLEKARCVKKLLDSYAADYLDGGNEFFGDTTKETVSEGIEKIISVTDKSEKQKTETYILKIKRAAALEDIFFSAKGYEAIGEIPNILEAAKTEIGGRLTAEDIRAYRDEKVAHISEIIRTFELNLANESINERVDGLKEKINGYKYVSDGKREELTAELDRLSKEACGLLSEETDGKGVKATLSLMLVKLSEFEAVADNEELLGCLSYVKTEISNVLGKKEYYTEENYDKAYKLAKSFADELLRVGSVEEYLDILSRATSEIGAIEDLLDTAKREGKEKLTALYEELMKKKHCYSAESLTTLEEIYTHSLTELAAIDVVPTEYKKAHDLTEERMKLMKGVRVRVVYTADGILAGGDDPAYPEDHNISEQGYIGAVWSDSGIPSDAYLTIKRVGSENILEIIKNAAKGKRVLSGGGAASRNIIRSLKNCSVLFGTEISLGEGSLDSGAYRVSILLPEEHSISDILGVVFVREDGSVEFFEPDIGDTLLEFETTHFSDYYVVSKGSIDLLPLIICLSVIVLCELCVLALLIIRRRKLKDSLYGIAPFPFVLASLYKPAGGNIIAAVLGVTALALLASISYLLYLEARSAKRKNRSLSESQEKSLVSVPTAKDVSPVKEQGETREMVYEIMQSVSAERAESLMSDAEAKSLQSQSNEGYEDTEIYYGDKKTEINIDIISQNFSDGDTVTLNSLKEKKLIPQSAGRVKILARGVLDKKLRIVAQDFSDAALKMILLTGGEAIVTYSASEQNTKRKIK